MVWGYFFGILKAHYFASWGHFIFDAATVGFYVGLIIKLPSKEEQAKWKPVLPWVLWLIVWPLFMALIPIQHYLVQIVGLRGNMFWIPMILVGAMLDRGGRNLLSITFAFLNVVAFGFALAEYYLGVEIFVPDNEVTQIVLNSNDIAGGHKRIPSIFANAHSYAGTMVFTVPWLILGLFDEKKWNMLDVLKRPILIAGLLFSILGVFIAGPRSPIVILGLLLVFALLTRQINVGFLLLSIVIGSVVAYYVAQDERMQRFTELRDLEMMTARVSMSMNMDFFEILSDYPMGNGMGAGGTSLPFFVQSLLTQRVLIENEYARILLEQGLPGLILFFAFVGWFFTRKIPKNDCAVFGKTILWSLSAITLATAWIGIGMMSSIPGTSMFLLGIGYCIAPATQEGARAGIFSLGNKKLIPSEILPAYQRGLARS